MAKLPQDDPFAALPFPPGALEPVEAKAVASLPTDSGWQFEPKWDGFRCIAFKTVSKSRRTSHTPGPDGSAKPIC